MADEYTPTTERVRSDYAETFEGTDERRYERFDRWLASIEREAAARALYDLAKDSDALESAARDGMNSGDGPFPWNAAKGVRDLLHDRAAEIREEMKDG